MSSWYVSIFNRLENICSWNIIKNCPLDYLITRETFLSGLFKTGVGKPNENNTARTIDLVCKNGANDAPPFWDPPYDHEINPFPECVFLRKYTLTLFHSSVRAESR